MRDGIAIRCVAVAYFVSLSANALDWFHGRDAVTDAYMQAAAETLGAEQRATLAKITDDGRRYLALTYYLRANSTIKDRWAWTNAEVEAYEQSPEFIAAAAEIDRVVKRFAIENPGYTLHTNMRVRTLEDQLLRWQSNTSVTTPARELLAAAKKELSINYPSRPTASSAERFRQFLKSWHPSQRAAVAAPGLSHHGRGRAFDFQIRDSKGRLVADNDTNKVESTWERLHWKERLAQAISTSSKQFNGPLESPNEPWHYEYVAGQPTCVRASINC